MSIRCYMCLYILFPKKFLIKNIFSNKNPGISNLKKTFYLLLILIAKKVASSLNDSKDINVLYILTAIVIKNII